PSVIRLAEAAPSSGELGAVATDVAAVRGGQRKHHDLFRRDAVARSERGFDAGAHARAHPPAPVRGARRADQRLPAGVRSEATPAATATADAANAPATSWQGTREL